MDAFKDWSLSAKILYIFIVFTTIIIGIMLCILMVNVSNKEEKKEQYFKDSIKYNTNLVQDYNDEVKDDISFLNHNVYVINGFKESRNYVKHLVTYHFEGYLTNDKSEQNFMTKDIVENTQDNLLISQHLSTYDLSLSFNWDNTFLYENHINI